jgi:hypothetical protein
MLFAHSSFVSSFFQKFPSFVVQLGVAVSTVGSMRKPSRNPADQLQYA